jgi:citrate synthase
MGMGHRIYRVRDPRAEALERAVFTLERAGGAADRLTLAHAVEREAERLLAERHPERPLRANVEFYTAVLLDAIGIPRTLFPRSLRPRAWWGGAHTSRSSAGSAG